jgi:Protein of unknown function (DUF3800)
MQKTFFGVPSRREAKYLVYHDESGTDRARERFLVQGALFVPELKWQGALDLLRKSRDGYSSRVHFVDLRDNTSSRKSRVAATWLSNYFASLSYYCPFKCMIADTASDSDQIRRFKKQHHLYNYTAMMAIRSAVPWCFGEYDTLELSIYSEFMDRSFDDNFTNYVPREVAKRANLKQKHSARAPAIVEPISDVVLVVGDPEKTKTEHAGHCEFIQLADLLTSAIGQIVNASAIQLIKIDLALLVASWIKDTTLPPWIQAHNLHRRFSVSCFPGADGDFYDVPLNITQKYQMKLF